MSKLAKREYGRVTLTDPGSDRPLLEAATLQCCHCGGHFAPRPGSGTVRGFCTRCMGPVCGPGCAECVPAEQLLTNLETGKPLDHRPIIVPVSFHGD